MPQCSKKRRSSVASAALMGNSSDAWPKIVGGECSSTNRGLLRPSRAPCDQFVLVLAEGRRREREEHDCAARAERHGLGSLQVEHGALRAPHPTCARSAGKSLIGLGSSAAAQRASLSHASKATHFRRVGARRIRSFLGQGSRPEEPLADAPALLQYLSTVPSAARLQAKAAFINAAAAGEGPCGGARLGQI